MDTIHEFAAVQRTKARRLVEKPVRGFTLVELLVVIAIIGILVALLLPAVQSARTAARGLQCKNKVKQLGLAVLNYEASNGHLPVAGLVEPNESSAMQASNFDPQTGAQLSWMVLILPFIEEQPLFDQFEIAVDVTVFEQPTDPQATFVESFMCPSDNAQGRLFTHSFTQGKPLAKGNYAAYVSPQHVGDLQFVPGALGGFKPGDPALRGQRMAKVKDGSSRTVAISEVLTRDNDKDSRGAWAVPWGASSVLAIHIDHLYSGQQSPLDLRSITHYIPDPNFLSWSHMPNALRPDLIYVCNKPVSAALEGLPCTRAGGGARIYASGSARSHHIGGVNAVALDGHVGFMSDEIDPYVMAHLVSTRDLGIFEVSEQMR